MLDRRERAGELLSALLALKEEFYSTLYVSLPGIVQSFNAAKRTAVIQPAIKAKVMGEDGTSKEVLLPLLLDCPVQFPGGGDVVITFPIKQGDEVLVIFADRCIDAWWQSGGTQSQAELRMHDLSDGYFIPGISSIPRVEANISTTEIQMRSRDGIARFALNPSTHEVRMETTGASMKVTPAGIAQVDATTINLNGTVNVTGTTNLTGTTNAVGPMNQSGGALNVGGKPYAGHQHSGVQGGTTNTGGVV